MRGCCGRCLCAGVVVVVVGAGDVRRTLLVGLARVRVRAVGRDLGLLLWPPVCGLHTVCVRGGSSRGVVGGVTKGGDVSHALGVRGRSRGGVVGDTRR